MDVFVAADGDDIGKLSGRARLADDPATLRQVSNSIEAGNKQFESWAVQALGQVVEQGGDEILVQVPVEALGQLEAVRERYESTAGATVSVGVGKKISEASKALLAAKLRGKDQVATYSKDVDQEVLQVKPQDEKAKLQEEYLGKADGGAGSVADHGRGVERPHMDHGETAKTPDDSSPTPAGSPEQAFHELAQKQDSRDRAEQTRSSGAVDKIRGQVAEALTKLQQQAPALQTIRAVYPEAHASILALVQSVIGLGREVDKADQALTKVELPAGYWQGSDFEIPSWDHPDRREFDAAYKDAFVWVCAGDRDALSFTNILKTEDFRESRIANPEEVVVFQAMLRAGDRLPPALVTKCEAGWEVLHGHAQLHAARNVGVETLDVVMVDSKPALLDDYFTPMKAFMAKSGRGPRQIEDRIRSRLVREEVEPHEEFPEVGTLDKVAPGEAVLPVGTLKNGKRKVEHWDGSKGWKGVKEGEIASMDPSGHPVSSRDPGGR